MCWHQGSTGTGIYEAKAVCVSSFKCDVTNILMINQNVFNQIKMEKML